MVVGAKVCELTDDLLWFVCGLYVGILTSPLSEAAGGEAVKVAGRAGLSVPDPISSYIVGPCTCTETMALNVR